MINIKFHQDEEGYFQADTEPQYALLGQYLESEIQGVAEVCQEILDTIAEIEVGDRQLVEGVGNAYGLKLTADRATIWSEFSEVEEQLEISLRDFKQSLKECLDYLQLNL
jgi:uncharacterized protein YacL (UPF0231 family)